MPASGSAVSGVPASFGGLPAFPSAIHSIALPQNRQDPSKLCVFFAQVAAITDCEAFSASVDTNMLAVRSPESLDAPHSH